MPTTFLPFVADILVYDPKPGRCDPWRLVMTGDAGITCEASLDRARDTIARWYLAPSEAGYASARAIVHEQCEKCHGNGTLYRGRRTRRPIPCRACKARGTWPVAETPIMNAEVV